MCARGEFVRDKSGAGELAGEERLDGGGPERDAAPGVQRAVEGAEPLAAVDLAVRLVDQCGRAVVHIEDDGVIRSLLRAADEGEDILGKDGNARVVEQPAIHGAEMLAVPGNDLGEEFRDVDDAFFPHQLEHALQAVTEPEPADEHAHPGGPGLHGAGTVGERLLGFRHGRAHERATVEPDEVFAVVLLEIEQSAVWRAGLGESDGGLHARSKQ